MAFRWLEPASSPEILHFKEFKLGIPLSGTSLITGRRSIRLLELSASII